MVFQREENHRLFKNSKQPNKLNADMSLLLVDLNKPERENDMLFDNHVKVFYMIQERERWLLSQPKVLDKF